MRQNSSGFHWQSSTIFVMVVLAVTLGMNDFLTFPKTVVENGGGLFLILYAFFLLVLSLPMLIAELLVGKIARADPSQSFALIAEQHKAAVYWKIVGLFALLASFLLIAVMSVIAGWSMSFSTKSLIGFYSDVNIEESRAIFNALLLDSERMLFWHSLFIILVVATVAQSVSIGIQKVFRIVLPIILVLALSILLASAFTGHIEDSIRSIFYFDYPEFNSQTPLIALEKAFYSLMTGLGLVVIIGRYLPDNISISYSATLVALANFLFVCISALAIQSFPANS